MKLTAKLSIKRGMPGNMQKTMNVYHIDVI